MEFNVETAKDIVKKYNLDEKTIRVWKKRNAIPDKYFNADYKPSVKADGESDEQLIKDILRILDYGKINISSFLRLAKVKPYWLGDIKQKGIVPKKDELLAVKKAIQTLRLEATKALTELNREDFTSGQIRVKNFLSRKEVVLHVFFKRDRTAKIVHSYIYGRRSTFPAEYSNDIAQAFAEFISETAML